MNSQVNIAVSSTGVTRRVAYSPSRSPSCPLGHFDNLALVSHPRHLDQLDQNEGTTLVVATEWAVWQVAVERGLAAVHHEGLLKSWPDEISPPEEVYSDACMWIYADGKDMTLYGDVSLGRLYGTFLAHAHHAVLLIGAALNRLCLAHTPRRIVLYDLSAHFGALGAAAKRQLVAEIAAEAKIEVLDRLDQPEAGDPWMHHLPCLAPRPAAIPTIRDRLRDVAAVVLEGVFRLRLFGRRNWPRSFLFVSIASLAELVERPPGRFVPVMSAAASPKNRKFLGACWRNGVLPARLAPPRPLARHHKAEAEIRTKVEAAWEQHPASGFAAVHRETVREWLFAPGVLASLAAQVEALAALLDRLGIKRVVTGDVSGPFGRSLCELAAVRGIGADETLNGMFLAPMKEPSRCGDGHIAPVVTRQLAFGQATLDWLTEISAPMESVVTGYPALGRPVATVPTESRPPRHALVLPCYAWLNELTAWRGEIFPLLVDTIRMLADLGIADIRLKLHPGVDNEAFFRRLVSDFDLPCTVVKQGSVAEHLDWADMVVGPATSGACLETLAVGKPYYILRPLPSGVPDHALPGAIIAGSAAELAEHIKAGHVPDRDRLLGHLCAFGVIDDPSAAVWRAIDEACAKC
jgi:hypothetical protein